MTYSTLHIIVITVYKINNNEKFYLLFTMATGTAVISISSPLTSYILNTNTAQPTVVVGGGRVYINPGGAAVTGSGTQGITFRVVLPASGLYKLYFTIARASDILRLYSKSGTVLYVLSSSGLETTGNFTIPQDTSVMGNDFSIMITSGASIASNTLTDLFRIGMNAMLTLSSYILNGQITNLLTMQSGETFALTATGVTIQLNRIFTAGTQLPIFRFSANLAGSYQVTSSNTAIVANEVSTSFAAGQDIGDYVDILTTSTSKMPLTLTMTVTNATGELPLNTVVQPL